MSPQGRDLILKLMAFRPQDRLSAAEALEHPWFKMASRGELESNELGDALSALKNFHTGTRLMQIVHTFFI